MKFIVNQIKYIIIAYGLWLLYLLYGTLNAAHLRYVGNVGKILAFIGGVILGRIIEVAIALLFWKVYSLKYKEERVLENVYRKAIAVGLLYLSLMGLGGFQFGPLFLFVTLLLAIRKFKKEADACKNEISIYE